MPCPKVETMFLFLVFHMPAASAAKAQKCELQFVKSHFDCILNGAAGDLELEGDLPEKAFYVLSPMSLEFVDLQFHKLVDVTPPDPAHADFSLDPERFQLGSGNHTNFTFDLSCKKNVEEFPNTCDGVVTFSSWVKDEMGLARWQFLYMVLSFYSTYTPEDGKVHEMVQAQFKYKTLNRWYRKCTSEVKFLSGDCFGMSTTREPRTPQDPPAGPDWMTPVHVVPPGGFPETTPAPTPEPTPAPGGMGVGGVILILLILALMGGAAFFFLRRRRLMQEQSLCDAREVELH